MSGRSSHLRPPQGDRNAWETRAARAKSPWPQSNGARSPSENMTSRLDRPLSNCSFFGTYSDAPCGSCALVRANHNHRAAVAQSLRAAAMLPSRDRTSMTHGHQHAQASTAAIFLESTPRSWTHKTRTPRSHSAFDALFQCRFGTDSCSKSTGL